MPTYKTPDVYIEELSVFPPSVAEVETAIPAFIGYTEIAKKLTTADLLNKPTKIYSLKEYETYYGYPKDDTIAITITTSGTSFVVNSFTEPTVKFYMYYAVKMFFDNGGGQCYIVSVGDYAATQDEPAITGGLNALALEDEPTLIVIPEVVKLSTNAKYTTVVTNVLTQCGTLKDRFAILDLYDGGTSLDTTALATNRGYIVSSYLKYGAAYYPFLKSAINFFVNSGETNVNVTLDGGAAATLAAVKGTNTAAYNFVKQEMAKHYVVVPASGAVAGVYAATDSGRGVWKAPANVALADVVEPVVKLDNTKQDALNVDVTGGKSINAIRAFSGKGSLVWGARTLAGNDNEWRYVSVRRFFNMVEESVKKSTYWAVFEPNDANTWVKVRGMIENYLTQKWREGALAGATTKEAFFVRCGLGVTMTSQDILEGRMNVEIGMAAVRPAEFIILKFSHMLQTS